MESGTGIQPRKPCNETYLPELNMTRTFQRPIKRIVVKLGSSQIADGKMRPRTAQLLSLCKQIGQLRKDGVEVVLVSSGAIALGMGELGETKRSTELAQLQARAAIGQAALMRLYSELLRKVGLKCGQVLLTWDDFDNRTRFSNARHTLEAILKKRVVPVINENDTTSTEEIKFGDNDKLSALVASLLHADLLVILSDVEGLYDADKKVYKEVREITAEIEGVARGTKNTHMARGGMRAKIDAIKIATHAHIPCVITNGNIKDVLVRLVAGARIGTYFIERQEKLLDGDSEHEFIRSHFKNSKGG
jgi:glutamate 5-kinase